MSYVQIRNFCEQMRALGYPRVISMENFQKSNFQLVAEILYWLVLRYEPNAEISDNINDMKDRIIFIKSIVELFASKARLKLDPKKLYVANNQSVSEMQKIAKMLYKAQITTEKVEDEVHEFILPTRLNNLKGTKQLAKEITDSGAKLFDLLGREKELSKHRSKAIGFLDNITRNFESNLEQDYIEKKVREIIGMQSKNVEEMKQYVQNLEQDNNKLETLISKKSKELQRLEKRLKSLTNVRPAFMDEYERQEKELEMLYNIYLEKFRNLDYLENQLDLYNQMELKKFEDAQKIRQKMQNQLKEEEMKYLRGEQELDEDLVDKERELLDQNPITQENSNNMMTGNKTRTNFFKNKIRPGEGLELRSGGGDGYGDVLGDDSGDSDLGADGNSDGDSGELQQGMDDDDDSEPDNDF